MKLRKKQIANLFVIMTLGLVFSCFKEDRSHEFNKIALEELTLKLDSEKRQIYREIQRLAQFTDSLLRHREEILQEDFSDFVPMNGPFSSQSFLADSLRSSPIILNACPSYEEGIEVLKFTQALDQEFARIYYNNPTIAQVYLNTHIQTSRVFPPLDVENLIDPDINVTDFNFYYEADTFHNPEKKGVWLKEPYVDPAGKGWIISLLHPVYSGEELFGVIGIDVAVAVLVEEYLESDGGKYLILNNEGTLIASSSVAVEYLGMHPLQKHIYKRSIKKEQYQNAGYNLKQSTSKEIREMTEVFLARDTDYYTFTSEPFLRDAYADYLIQTDWVLVKLNSRD